MKPRSIGGAMILANVVLYMCCAGFAWTQDASEQPAAPLGDVARKSRAQRSDKDHVAAKKVLTSEGGPKPTPHVYACKLQFCSKLTVTLPVPVVWNNAGYLPVPLPGHEDDKSRFIRIYAADSLAAREVEGATRVFLKERFAQPYFFGQAPKFMFQERTGIDGWPARITHFTVTSRVMKFQGLGLVAAVPDGTFGFACVFRDEDSGDATPVCESILNSAKIEVREEYRHYVQPEDPPSDDPPDDPPSDDPPGENDMQRMQGTRSHNQ